MKKPRCIVWLPADHRLLGSNDFVGSDDCKMPFLVLGSKYASAIKDSVGAQPVVFPMATADDIEELLGMVDGVMLTGSPSNIHPSHFGESINDPSLPLDPHRDALTLALVRACVAKSVPLLGVCRGFQEINVAMGGSLLQQVQLVAGMMDHREPRPASIAKQYAASHSVQFVDDCVLTKWAGGNSAEVNSLHGQGVGRLASGLRALAHAPDGLVEAFEVQGAKTFSYAVQWHPEWCTAENPFHVALFKAFGDACRERNASRNS